MTELWAAPVATQPIDAVVALPGSKSATNRALVLAAIAESPSVLRRPLRARDTELMAAGLRSLGTSITDTGEDWAIEPRPLGGDARVDCGLAGTVMRFLPSVAALGDGDVTFDGDPRSHERPMRPLVESLRALGVDIDDAGRAACRSWCTGTDRSRAAPSASTPRRRRSSSAACCWRPLASTRASRSAMSATPCLPRRTCG